MAKAKRRFNTFNLSFLDIMSCGFGAVILVYLIIDHSMEVQSKELNQDLLSEVVLLEEDVTDGEEGLVKLRNTLSDIDFEIVTAQGRATRITDDLDEYEALLRTLEADGFTDRSEVDSLKAEVRRLEDEVEKLREASEDQSGNSARDFTGDGQRQYLTGLNLGGDNILILLDVSASMLAQELVNVIRLRNMDPTLQRSAAKWTRILNTVNWLSAQLPIASEYQVYTFNTKAQSALPDTTGKWLKVSDQEQLVQVTGALSEIVPSGGTSLANAFTAIDQLSPPPDNIFLITDGLPTQGPSSPRKNTVSERERIELFNRAVRQLPRNVPVNIILAPMEGDPRAASAYWVLAQSTQGSFMSPAADWP